MAIIHHPKVIIAMIECREPVSDTDVVRADRWMAEHPREYPCYLREGIRQLGEAIAQGNADHAEMTDWVAQMNATMEQIRRRFGGER